MLYVGFFSFSVGGSIPVVWTYFGEFQPRDKRGMMLSLLASFWMVGNVLVAVIAWAIIPFDIGITEGDFLFNSWRIFVFLCGLPAFFVSILLFTLPESPKFILRQKKPVQALKVIRQMFATNTGRSAALFSVDALEMEPDREQMQNSSTVQRVISNTLGLFSKSLWKITCMMLYINFAIAFGYYGLWLWFPQLFTKLDQYYTENPNATVSVCEITDFKPHGTDNKDPFCGPPPTSQVFTNSIYISLAAAPSNLWTVIHMDKLGRKFFLGNVFIIIFYFLTGR